MTEHRYSVDEIDAMRRAVQMMSTPYSDSAEAVEARLRTYMVNGTTVAELEEAATKSVEERARRHQGMMAHVAIR